MLDEVQALQGQKKTLQQEIAELFTFKAKHGGGAPDMPPMAMSPLTSPYRPPGAGGGPGPLGLGSGFVMPPPAARAPPPPVQRGAASRLGGLFGPRPPA